MSKMNVDGNTNNENEVGEIGASTREIVDDLPEERGGPLFKTNYKPTRKEKEHSKRLAKQLRNGHKGKLGMKISHITPMSRISPKERGAGGPSAANVATRVAMELGRPNLAPRYSGNIRSTRAYGAPGTAYGAPGTAYGAPGTAYPAFSPNNNSSSVSSLGGRRRSTKQKTHKRRAKKNNTRRRR